VDDLNLDISARNNLSQEWAWLSRNQRQQVIALCNQVPNQGTPAAVDTSALSAQISALQQLLPPTTPACAIR